MAAHNFGHTVAMAELKSGEFGLCTHEDAPALAIGLTDGSQSAVLIILSKVVEADGQKIRQFFVRRDNISSSETVFRLSGAMLVPDHDSLVQEHVVPLHSVICRSEGVYMRASTGYTQTGSRIYFDLDTGEVADLSTSGEWVFTGWSIIVPHPTKSEGVKVFEKYAS